MAEWSTEKGNQSSKAKGDKRIRNFEDVLEQVFITPFSHKPPATMLYFIATCSDNSCWRGLL